MRKEIQRFFQELWNQLKKTLTDKRGDFPLGNVKPEGGEVIEREIVINNTRIHIRSIFSGQTGLDEAVKKIIIRKLAEKKVNLTR